MVNVISQSASVCHIECVANTVFGTCGSVVGLLSHAFHIGFIFLLYPGFCSFLNLILLRQVRVFRLTASCNLLDFLLYRVVGTELHNDPAIDK